MGRETNRLGWMSLDDQGTDPAAGRCSHRATAKCALVNGSFASSAFLQHLVHA